LRRPRRGGAAAGAGRRPNKPRLQELATQTFDQLPRYQVRHEGPDHSKHFFATVLLRGEPWGTGEGRSKKHAEQAAARVAWRHLCEVANAQSPDGARLATNGTEMSRPEDNDAGGA